MIKSRSGFTLVELLIVIVVIAILAAIAIVAYNGIQDRAKASGVKSDLSTAKKKLMLWKIENNKFPSSLAELRDVGIKATPSLYYTDINNFTYCVNTATDNFAIGAQIDVSGTGSNGVTYYISSTGDIQENDNSNGRAAKTCGILGDTYPGAGMYATNGYNNTAAGWHRWTGAN